MDTVDGQVSLTAKNSEPTVTKQVQEDSARSDFGEKNDADIGQEVTFKATLSVPIGTENLIFHDVLSEGLDYIGVTSVTVNDGAAISADEAGTAYYSVVTSVDADKCDDSLGGKCDFHVVFTTDFLKEKITNTSNTVTIIYKAKLNDKAKIGPSEGNPNTCNISYSENNLYATKSETKTYTFELPIFKYTNKATQAQTTAASREEDGRATTKVGLPGAKFILSTDGTKTAANDVDNATKIKFKQKVDTDGNPVPGEYYVTQDTDGVYEIVSNSQGNIKVAGLDADQYYLYESAAPKGYELMEGCVNVTIFGAFADGDRTPGSIVQGLNTPVDRIEVVNNSGTRLPATGGIGTTIFYVAGSILLVGAAILLIVKKRMSDEK